MCGENSKEFWGTANVLARLSQSEILLNGVYDAGYTGSDLL